MVRRCGLLFVAGVLAILVLAVGAEALGDPAGHQVFLFQHTNYGGSSLSFSFDTDVPDLRKWRLANSKKNWNDVLSSLKLGKNAKIILYQHINYGGASITLQANGQNVKNYPNLHNIGWGDKASSFKVRMSDYAQ